MSVLSLILAGAVTGGLVLLSMHVPPAWRYAIYGVLIIMWLIVLGFLLGFGGYLTQRI